jgi:tRNA dimethylallyltransferase
MYKSGNGKLVAIVGETGAGKSALALEMAERYNGELICADSRTVYKGMDIGTAKPNTDDQARIRHHILDVVTPDQGFNVADFQKLATQAILDITARGRLPIMVGGTGLYIDSILYDYEFNGPVSPAERERYLSLSVEELQAELTARGIQLPLNSQNPRHLQRALETGGVQARRKALRPNTLVIGLQVDKTELKHRLSKRVETMVEQGLIEEVKSLFAQYGPDTEALRAPGYQALLEHIEGRLTLDEAKALFVQNDLKLAKRQRTWFKRNNSIQWLSDPSKYVELVTTFINQTA